MSAVRGPVVNEDPGFAEQKAALVEKYPQIERIIVDLKDFFYLGYSMSEVLVDADELPGVYAIKLDYPPNGARGQGVLLLTYHAADQNVENPMTDPPRIYTLLTIVDLD